MIQILINKLKKLIQFKRKHKTSTTFIGNYGEKLAVNFLKKQKQYKILARNWSHKKDEIDIIAQEGEVVVFVEVKTRSTQEIITAYHSVTSKKKQCLERACKAYLRHTKPTPKHFRFDIIVVKFCKTEKNVIQHYSNIKLFSKNFHPLTYDR